MSDNIGKHRPFDPVSEGAKARKKGQPKDSCPYGAGTADRGDWMQGFEGGTSDRPPDLPLDGR